MADPEVTCTTNLEHTCRANALFDELVQDIPVFDTDTLTDLLDINPIYDEASFTPLTPLTLDSLTTGEVGGTGAFDVLMESVNNHLKNEYDNNRISGAEFTRAYIALTESAMANSVQFLLQKDRSYWDAVTAQIQANQAQILLAQAKVQTITSLAQLEYQKAQYAVTKLSLDKLNIEVSEILPLEVEKASYELNEILPKQVEKASIEINKATFELNEILPKQVAQVTLQNDKLSFELEEILPLQVDKTTFEINELLPLQAAQATLQNEKATFEIEEILPLQVAQAILQNQKSSFELEEILPLQVDKATIEVNEVLPLQVEKATFEMNKILPKQDELIKAQVAKEWAATKNKGPSWTPGAVGQPDTVSPNTDDIEGVIGLQKNLYTQQEKSYKQDTINSTLQHLHSTWAAGITNGIPGIQIPDAVHKDNFSSKVINPQLAALAANSGWAYAVPDPITEP